MTMMFSPSDEQRRTVKALAAVGVPHDAIAGYIDVDPKTLRKAFRLELDHGALEATAKVGQTLFSIATVDRNVAACIFWLKARAGWREKQQVEVTGEGGGPIRTQRVVIDAAALSPADRAALRQALLSARERAA